jgi:hypothetical protein
MMLSVRVIIILSLVIHDLSQIPLLFHDLLGFSIYHLRRSRLLFPLDTVCFPSLSLPPRLPSYTASYASLSVSSVFSSRYHPLTSSLLNKCSYSGRHRAHLLRLRPPLILRTSDLTTTHVSIESVVSVCHTLSLCTHIRGLTLPLLRCPMRLQSLMRPPLPALLLQSNINYSVVKHWKVGEEITGTPSHQSPCQASSGATAHREGIRLCRGQKGCYASDARIHMECENASHHATSERRLMSFSRGANHPHTPMYL